MMNRFMQLTNQNENSADIYIYGDIVDFAWWEEDVTANSIRSQIEQLDVKELNVHINSYGGDVFTGIAIYNLLKNHPAKVNVYIDSCACSIASVIAMAGDKIYMPKNTFMMIHNCWCYVMGNSNELRKQADDLDKIMNASIESYLAKVNISKEKLIELLNEESWLTADECVEMGFADVVIPLNQNGNTMQSAVISKLLQRKEKMEYAMPVTDTEQSSNEEKKQFKTIFLEKLIGGE